jgi:redox-sensitive bicupin YhaK (pirin superfamily)
MIRLRKSRARGQAQHGWLDTRHTFSFADYFDPEHMGFRALRVLNEDTIEPGRGFATHSHRDMDILTFVLDGALEHRDSLGNGSVIRPGDVQRMSAGTGVAHSEFNPSPHERTHLLQIWILPEKSGMPPSYEQKSFPAAERRGRLLRVASSDGAGGSVTVHQDVALYATVLGRGETVRQSIPHGRHAWLQVAAGAVTLNGHALEAGDGAALSEEAALELRGDGEGSEALLFDLA